MSDFLVLKCDECGAESKEREATGWYRLEAAGIDVSTMTDPPLPAHFCGHECLCHYLHKRDQ